MPILLDDGEQYEAAFLVMRMSSGTVLLSPDLKLRVNAVREPGPRQVFSALSVLHANIAAMKSADMTMASLANQAAFAQRMSQDEQLKKDLGL
jgi:hypothetical protein